MTELTQAEEMIRGAQFVSVFEVVEQEAPGMATICSVASINLNKYGQCTCKLV